jgi:hypothetical protein
MSPSYGLQYSDLYGRVQDYANVNNITNSKTKAQTAVKDAVRRIAGLRNWEILKRESSLVPVASTQAYNILTAAPDFDRIISCWYVLAGERLEIDVIDDEHWANIVNNTIVGTPESCRITKVTGVLQIQFSPLPSSSFITQAVDINFDYIKKPIELVNDTDIPDVPDTSEQLAIVYFAISDLLGKQGDLDAMAAWEAKAKKILDSADRTDDEKGRTPRIGKPVIPINTSRGVSMMDYKNVQ